MAKSGSSTVQYNLENILKQTMRLQKKKKEKKRCSFTIQSIKVARITSLLLCISLELQVLELAICR